MDGYKVVVLGELSVGKTSLFLRLCKDSFVEKECSTIGAAFYVHKMVVDGREFKLEVWDTAGQERFRTTLPPMYYKRASGAVVAFDITNKESLEKLRPWIDELKQNAPPDVKIILVGTKSDLDDRRAVDTDTINQFCEEFGIPYFETSAKTGAGVVEAFTALVRMLPDLPSQNDNSDEGDNSSRKCIVT